ncbi:MAG: hypothetical protein GEU75_06770 [Dehalococcoidia bacterium]|nr:hypothetical protein [Dehalococcoidia bacterium]
MQATATSPSRSNIVLWVLAVLGVGLLAVFAFPRASSPDAPLAGHGLPGGQHVAYFAFGSSSDTLWLVDPAQPSQRRKVLVAPHATDFGVVPSLAPDRRSFLFASLPATIKAPSPETPADLWLSDVTGSAPSLVASGIDLLVPAVWSRDGQSTVFRRSRAASQAAPSESRLFILDLQTGGERELAAATDAALFPVGFAPDGRFYLVRLDGSGSYLVTIGAATGEQAPAVQIAPGLTRDWTLSPAGTELAYLEMELTPDSVSSSAFVLDLATGTVEPAATGDAFGPIWTSSGELVVGQDAVNDNIASFAERGGLSLPRPARGFDVPLAFTTAGDLALVRAFEGSSAMAPGRSLLAVLGLDGSRTTIASGEVTFLGWINP